MKVSELWAAVDAQRIAAGSKKRAWQRSYEGVKAALLHRGFQLEHTKEEFDDLPVPTDDRQKHYLHRKVIVETVF